VSTVNSDDPDVSQVAAALADAALGGGLSSAYYRAADDALKRLMSRLPARPSGILILQGTPRAPVFVRSIAEAIAHVQPDQVMLLKKVFVGGVLELRWAPLGASSPFAHRASRR
jgi:hypothetical protein